MQAELIPHSRPFLGPEESAAAGRVLASGMLSEGPEVPAFESELAAATGAGRACALAHGTGALHLALLGLGAGPGRRVLLPAYSCVSVLNAVSYTGSEPVLVDCAPDSPLLALDQVAELGRPGDLAVAVHLFGQAVDLRSWPRGVALIEDATHALGAPGVGFSGRACLYSFYATKMLAGGEGGALTTRSARLDAFVRDHRSYDKKPHWRVRYNYKMTEVAAAVLRVQLERLPFFLRRRAQLAAFYREGVGGLPGVVLPPREACYRFVLRLPGRRLDNVLAALSERGVAAARPVFQPLHHALKLPARNFPRAQAWWREGLSLPLYPALTDEHAARVVQALRDVL